MTRADDNTTTVAFIGDAARAAGFRLAGVRTWSPEPGHEACALEEALEQAGVVVLSAALAQRLPPPVFEAACARLFPLVVIEPDSGTAAPAIDPVSRVRHQLSLEVNADAPAPPAPAGSAPA